MKDAKEARRSAETPRKTRALMALASLMILGVIGGAMASGDHSATRHISTYSFKAPFFPDAGQAAVPGWEVRGGAVVSSEYVRLTPDAQSRTGFLVSRKPCYMRTFELTLGFHIWSNSGLNIGADGLALWMIDSPLKPGPVYGGQDMWKGLAIVMDSYDNSGLKSDSTRIAVHLNDGTKPFQMHTDGDDTAVLSCQAKYRNADLSYLHLYFEKDLLHLYVDPQGTGNWEQCGKPAAFAIPERYYFGISAATGGLTDNHDVHYLTVNTMDPAGSSRPTQVKELSEAAQKEEAERLAQEERNREMDRIAQENKAADEAFRKAQQEQEELAQQQALILQQKELDQAREELEQLKRAEEERKREYQATLSFQEEVRKRKIAEDEARAQANLLAKIPGLAGGALGRQLNQLNPHEGAGTINNNINTGNFGAEEFKNSLLELTDRFEELYDLLDGVPQSIQDLSVRDVNLSPDSISWIVSPLVARLETTLASTASSFENRNNNNNNNAAAIDYGPVLNQIRSEVSGITYQINEHANRQSERFEQVATLLNNDPFTVIEDHLKKALAEVDIKVGRVENMVLNLQRSIQSMTTELQRKNLKAERGIDYFGDDDETSLFLWIGIGAALAIAVLGAVIYSRRPKRRALWE
eukprot:TRINITY_DN9742_c0_g1_i1.p1 TRINITY_DN9742_c0_g1~~TRINITY_DN9742_c0_g1_i1.p1  ORF type:complete len:659 (-),score=278.30 TRINITY_DN9742_c0_g1_i1:53-1972(-)